MPKRYLDDLCPFQMGEYYSEGEHGPRIIREKMVAADKAMQTGALISPMGAEGAEAFSEFQDAMLADPMEASLHVGLGVHSKRRGHKSRSQWNQ